MSLFSCGVVANLRICVGLFAWLCCVPVLSGQDAVYPPPEPSPAKIENLIVLLNEQVVQEQWTHTLDLVNMPPSVPLLNPGQCIRVGFLATGDNRDDYLRQTKVSFQVKFVDDTLSYDSALLPHLKKIKLDGGDFMTGAFAVAGIKLPNSFRTIASLGVSASTWCVPADAQDGTATVEATIEAPGTEPASVSSVVAIETFSTGRQKRFADGEEFGRFLQTYYQQPNPARLLPAIEFMVSEQTNAPRQGLTEIVGAFMSAALKADAAAAHNLLSKIGSESELVRAFGLLVLRSAGYDIGPVLRELPEEEQANVKSLPDLEDPYDQSPSQELFHRLDMLWGVFGATGQYEPVKAVASTLAWRSDYEALVELRNNPNHSPELTASVVRGIVYSAAGWSLQSLRSQDGLIADYIEYMRTSEEIPPSVKSELGALDTNPAFRGPGEQ